MDVATEPPVGVLDTPVITPRPLADYRNMFLLTDEELLAGPILDCPAGSSPFGAQVRARGGTVVSVDPAYARPRAELVDQLAADLAMLRPRVEANRANIDWSYLGSPDTMMRIWELATDLFLADYEPDGERYVAASLASLPFPDKHFRLALSSHLLFTYPVYLSFEQHVAGLLELLRVTDGEVRAFPLVDFAGVAYPRIDEVCATLAEHGVRTELRRAACAYSLGGDEMLVLRRDT
jgi:hypothetical protein